MSLKALVVLKIPFHVHNIKVLKPLAVSLMEIKQPFVGIPKKRQKHLPVRPKLAQIIQMPLQTLIAILSYLK